MYQVKANDKFLFKVDEVKGAWRVDEQDLQLDISRINDRTFHVLFNHKSYTAELVEISHSDKSCQIKLNGHLYRLSLEDQFDQLLKQLGMDSLNTSKVLEIKAPMPGLVLDVLTTVESEVRKGDNLLILEAMKMENILKSSTDGLVKKILVKKGEKVEKNQVLIQFH